MLETAGRGLLGTVGTVAREEGLTALWAGLEPGMPSHDPQLIIPKCHYQALCIESIAGLQPAHAVRRQIAYLLCSLSEQHAHLLSLGCACEGLLLS